MQEKLYKDLCSGRKTVGALANQYSLSKARLEAVRKLKEVEMEMNRQVSAIHHRSLIPETFLFLVVFFGIFG